MGNSVTKEQKPSASRQRSSDPSQPASPIGSIPQSASFPISQEQNPQNSIYNVRAGRGSRPDLSTLLGIRTGPTPDIPALETRRASKQEREAKKLELERAAREEERERSMKEEHIDGGYLVTQGVYTGSEDYSKGIVRKLMIERRIAPFWRGLNEHSDSWTENQLVAAARGKPIPAPDEIPEDEPKSISPGIGSKTNAFDANFHNLTVPITTRSQSSNSDTSSNMSPSQTTFPPGSTIVPPSISSSAPGTTFFRGRAKTLAALTTSNKCPQTEIVPREMQLPKDPFVSGQPIEAILYKDASECPICFLYYPPYLNKTRCCDQPICSECFVQIKRPDPHPPEHADPSAPPLPSVIEGTDPDELISEPAACPFCVQPEFGITYDPPQFRRGLTYVNHPSTHSLANAPSAMSSASSLASAQSGRLSPTGSGRRRTTSVSATSPAVITTDRVRPDWHQKLTSARAHTARRSAAATALHTAAYLMGNRHDSDSRALGSFGRRGILRRSSRTDNPSGANSSQLNMLALMSERYGAANAARGEVGESILTPSLRGSSRRNRVDDLEEIMMMEAIRLSLASEEDRRKREEKDAKKDTKKRGKENKKAEKAARKAGVYPSSANQSTAKIDESIGETSASQGILTTLVGKGKATQQDPIILPFQPSINSTSYMAGDPQEHLERARAQILPGDAATSFPHPYRPSHLRTLSNASSSGSSAEGSNSGSIRTDRHGQVSPFNISPDTCGTNNPSPVPAQDTYISGTPPGGGAGTESIFNFRSLAAMVGHDDGIKNATSERNLGQTNSPDRQTSETAVSDASEAKVEDLNAITKVEGVTREQTSDALGDPGLPYREAGSPSSKIAATSRTDPDLTAGIENRKHAAIGIENASQVDPQATS